VASEAAMRLLKIVDGLAFLRPVKKFQKAFRSAFRRWTYYQCHAASGRAVLQHDQAMSAVAPRYDKLAASNLAFIKLASVRIWLRANESTPPGPCIFGWYDADFYFAWGCFRNLSLRSSHGTRFPPERMHARGFVTRGQFPERRMT